MRRPLDPVAERLGAKDHRQVQVLRVPAAWLGGVDRDAQVVAGDSENVAVQCDGPNIGMVDDLAAGMLARIGELGCFPKRDESGARSAQFLDEGDQTLIARVTTGGHAKSGDESFLERRAPGRGVHGSASGADQVAPHGVAFDPSPTGGLAH